MLENTSFRIWAHHQHHGSIVFFVQDMPGNQFVRFRDLALCVSARNTAFSQRLLSGNTSGRCGGRTHTLPSLAASECAAMAAQSRGGVGSSPDIRQPVLFHNDATFQLLVDANLELIENEGAGICLAASGQQALVAHCARQGKRVPPALP